jgi:CBS domain-containing protein
MAKQKKLREVMTPDPLSVQATATVAEAAKAMKGADVGPMPVVDDDGNLFGVLTDRDITVRVVAESRDPKATKVGDVASVDLTTLAPDDSVDEAVRLMRERAVRRLPIVEGGKPVGIVSIGDLAMERDPDSALADISAAPAND